MKQVICIESSIPSDFAIIPVVCVVKDCIYTPLWCGPIDSGEMLIHGTGQPNLFYKMLETGEHSFHHISLFRDYEGEIEDVEISEIETVNV